jgi:anti-sigma B factor antagonist
MRQDGPDSTEALGALQVEQRPVTGDELVIGVRGELDLGTVAMFMDAVDEAIDSGAAAVVLDLSKLTFIDSSGVGAYVTAFRRAKEHGSHLRIGERSSLVDRVLQISGIEDALAQEG